MRAERQPSTGARKEINAGLALSVLSILAIATAVPPFASLAVPLVIYKLGLLGAATGITLGVHGISREMRQGATYQQPLKRRGK